MTYATIWAYPWDLVDEGVDRSLDLIRDDLGLTAVSVAASYHTFQALLPHNPVRKVLSVGEAAVYFPPDQALYAATSLQPNVSPLMGTGDWLGQIASGCQRQGLDLVAWTVCLHNSWLARRHPAAAVRNVFGDPDGAHLCPSSDEARAYVRALCVNLARDYGLRAVELESLHWHGFVHHAHPKVGVALGPIDEWLLSLCFCPACQSRGEAAGVDVGRLAEIVRARLAATFAAGRSPERDSPGEEARAAFVAATPELAAYQSVREATAASLVREVREAVRCQLYVILMGDRWISGLDPALIAPLVDRVEVLAYTPSPAAAARTVESALRGLTGPEQLTVGLCAFPPASPDEAALLGTTRAALDRGVRALSLYNYGLIPAANLPWVAKAVAALRRLGP